MATKRRVKEPLYQVFVLDRQYGNIPVSPMMNKQVCEQILSVVSYAIKSGKRTDWADPTMVLALTHEGM